MRKRHQQQRWKLEVMVGYSGIQARFVIYICENTTTVPFVLWIYTSDFKKWWAETSGRGSRDSSGLEGRFWCRRRDPDSTEGCLKFLEWHLESAKSEVLSWLIVLFFMVGQWGRTVIISILQMKKLMFKGAGLKALRDEIIGTECDKLRGPSVAQRD